MHLQTRLLIAATATLGAASLAAAAVSFSDDFSAMPTGACVPDESILGAWRFVYNGYGCNAFLEVSGDTVLMEQPAAATSPSETHASLVTGPWTSGDVVLSVSTATTRQLRTGSAPNPWEVGWVLWNYTDDEHFYYFVAKPNGWELGKADPAYPGAQRFLATGSSPRFPIGVWYRVRIAQTRSSMQVFVNDVLVASFTDSERPYSSGRLALYSEDAEAYFDDIVVEVPGRPRGRKKR